MKKVLFALSFLFSILTNAKVVDEILVIVNKNVILKSDLLKLKNNIKKGVLFDVEYASLFDLKELTDNRKTQLDYLISERLFIDHAKKNGVYKKAKSQLDEEIKKIAKSNQLTLSQFKKEIEGQGVDFSDYRSFILKSLIRKRVIDSEITSRIEISESDIVQYLLQKGSSNFEPSYQYSISHIVIPNDSKVDQVSNSILKSGFEKSLKFSENQENKGFLGSFKSNELAKPFRSTVKDLKISEVSAPIVMNNKIFFIRLDDKKRINELPDTPEVRKARLAIIQSSISTEVQAWIEEKRQTSHIVVKKTSKG